MHGTTQQQCPAAAALDVATQLAMQQALGLLIDCLSRFHVSCAGSAVGHAWAGLACGSPSRPRSRAMQCPGRVP